jgi:hypothetical protein
LPNILLADHIRVVEVEQHILDNRVKIHNLATVYVHYDYKKEKILYIEEPMEPSLGGQADNIIYIPFHNAIIFSV